jgi:hypothetical protein
MLFIGQDNFVGRIRNGEMRRRMSGEETATELNADGRRQMARKMDPHQVIGEEEDQGSCGKKKFCKP